MKIHFFIALLLSCLFATSQEVVLTKNDIPEIGKKIIVNYNKVDSPIVLSGFSTAGTDNFWDFSNYNFSNIDTVRINSINNSDPLFTKSKFVHAFFWNLDSVYVNYNDSELVYDAVAKPFFRNFGGPVNAICKPSFLRYKFPLMYPNAINGVSTIRSFGRANYDSLNNVLDSQYISETRTYSHEIIAKGKIRLKSGIYNSILEHDLSYLLDSVFIKNSQTDWKWKFNYIVGYGYGENYYWYVNGCIIPAVEYRVINNWLGIRENELPTGEIYTDEPGRLKIYPIPAINNIYISGLNSSETNYKLFDITGRLVDTGEIENNSLEISHISIGSYMLYLFNKSNDLIFVNKIIKIN